MLKLKDSSYLIKAQIIHSVGSMTSAQMLAQIETYNFSSHFRTSCCRWNNHSLCINNSSCSCIHPTSVFYPLSNFLFVITYVGRNNVKRTKACTVVERVNSCQWQMIKLFDSIRWEEGTLPFTWASFLCKILSSSIRQKQLKLPEAILV